MSQPLAASKSGPLQGHIRVPGDKSISHRSLIFGALATGVTRIQGLLEATDILATAKAVEALGAGVQKEPDEWVIHGNGVGGFKAPEKPLDFGNSGTGSRLMMGAIAGNNITVELTGDESLCSRPMGRILKPLLEMGLGVTEQGKDKLPLTLIGTDSLMPITYTLPVASAQVKSAVLIAGLHARGETSVIEPSATRDHSERMLEYFGAEITRKPHEGGQIVTVKGDAELAGKHITVPGDPSSAAFLTAATILCPGSEIAIEGVLVNPTRFGFYETLLEMGADIELRNKRNTGGEPVADLYVRASKLKGVTVPPERAPSMIDEYPCLSVLASFAEGKTHMQGLGELRVKECDRLTVTAEGLEKCGVECEIVGDDLIVTGSAEAPGGAMVSTEMDHRIAMSFLVMGLAAKEAVSVDDISMIKTSFPQFTQLMKDIGATFQEVEA